jgi:hypothetical protein
MHQVPRPSQTAARMASKYSHRQDGITQKAVCKTRFEIEGYCPISFNSYKILNFFTFQKAQKI